MNAVIELTTAARVLAQLRARNAVKDAIRRQGHKPSALTAAEIKSWAELYVSDHPALREQALQDARAMILDGLLGKRAQRALAETESVRKGSGNRTLAERKAHNLRTNEQCRT